MTPPPRLARPGSNAAPGSNTAPGSPPTPGTDAASPDPPHTTAPSPCTAPGEEAQLRVRAYLHTLGVGDAAAEQHARTLDARIDPELTDPPKRVAAMLEALDRWTEALPAQLGLPDAGDRVAATLALHLGELLDRHPEALADADALIRSLAERLNGYPNGLLPVWPRREMHRQPLGDLPGVLRGEFWSGTYRWVIPAADKSLRKLKAEAEPGTPQPAAEA
ncbi:MAG: hypothetical protein AAFX76_02795 [Planctomycetota bacterium]